MRRFVVNMAALLRESLLQVWTNKWHAKVKLHFFESFDLIRNGMS